VGDDRDTPLLADAGERLVVGEPPRDEFLDPEREDVPGLGGDLHPRDADEVVLAGRRRRRERGLYAVVVGDGQRVESHGLRLLQQQLDGVAAVVRQFGVGVEFDRQHVRAFGGSLKKPPGRGVSCRRRSDRRRTDCCNCVPVRPHDGVRSIR